MVRVLERGSAQFLKWLPVVFVPALVPWTHSPLANLAGSSGSLSGAVVAAAKVFARESGARCSCNGCAHSPPPLEARGARFRAAANVTKLLLAVAGGWLAHIGSAAAVMTALSSAPSSSSPTSPATPDATATAVVAADFFGPRLAKRLGIATLVVGAGSYPLMALADAPAPFFRAVGDLFLLPAAFGPPLSVGLATLFGFAAGKVGVSPGGAFDSSGASSSWKAALLPLATSVGATVLVAGIIGRPFGLGFSDMRDMYVADTG